MPESNPEMIQMEIDAFFSEIALPAANVSVSLNSFLNKYLSWPVRAGSGIINDLEGKSIQYDTVIYTNSKKEPDEQLAQVKADEVACGVHLVKTLGQEELKAGYEHIAFIKRMKKTEISGVEYPINNTPLGIIVAVESEVSIEEIGDQMKQLNMIYPSNEWPDMVVILTRGTINYVVQFPGQSIIGDFFLPNKAARAPMPAYIHMFAQGLELSSMNKFCAFFSRHLQTFFPGINLPDVKEVLRDNPPGMTLGAYQFSLSSLLVPVPDDYLKGLPGETPFRIEDTGGNLLCHLQYAPWQDGGVVRSVGSFPLDRILIFLGNVARNGQVIKLSDGAISSVLPIQRRHFIEMLQRFNKNSSMVVKPETPNWTLTKYSDEGSTSPYIARLFIGIMRLRDNALTDLEKRKEFDKVSEFVLDTLMNIRVTGGEIVTMVNEHSRKVSQGEIAHIERNIIRIDENIDNKLRNKVEEFLNASVRVVKDGMQKLMAYLDVDIAVLYKKKKAFEAGIGTLAETQPELAAYLQKTRDWSERLILVRNDLHGGWMLPRVCYRQVDGSVQAVEPQILNQPVTRFVEYMLDRLCCFVEEVSVYGLQTQLPSVISITEIPIAERKEIMPERFQVTFKTGGMPIWRISYHTSKFEES